MGAFVAKIAKWVASDTITKRRENEKAFIEEQKTKLDKIVDDLWGLQQEKSEIYQSLADITDEEGKPLPMQDVMFSSYCQTLSNLNVRVNATLAAKGRLEQLINVVAASELVGPQSEKAEKTKQTLLKNIRSSLKKEANKTGEDGKEKDEEVTEEIMDSLAELIDDINGSMLTAYTIGATPAAASNSPELSDEISKWKKTQSTKSKTKSQTSAPAWQRYGASNSIPAQPLTETPRVETKNDDAERMRALAALSVKSQDPSRKPVSVVY